MKCLKCGAELSEDSKFCSYCGAKVELLSNYENKKEEATITPSDKKVSISQSYVEILKTLTDKIKEKTARQWRQLSTYCKIATISIAGFALLFIVALIVGKTVAILFSFLQILLAVYAVLMDREIIKLEQKQIWIKWLMLGIAVSLTGINVRSYSWGKEEQVANRQPSSIEQIDDKQWNQLEIESGQQIKQNERSEKDGFDSTTNEIYDLAGYTVEIPQYWKDEKKIFHGIQRYAEKDGRVAMIQVTVQAENDDSYPVTFNGLMDDNDNMISMLENTVFTDVTSYEVIDTGIIKGILYKGTLVEKESGVTGYGEWFTFASEEDRNWCALIMCQTDNTDYLYTDDFMKMIQSIKPKESNSDNPPITEMQPTEITLTMGHDDFKGMNYQEAEKIFREMGFTNFKYRTVDTEDQSLADTICYIDIAEWFIGRSNFTKGDKFDSDSTVTFFSYKYESPVPASAVFYSTNDYETAKKGNTGVFAYKKAESTYDIYWIIDFDKGYTYYFADGNGDTTCDRLKIDSGTLNDKVTITYHDGSNEWSNSLHFNYVEHPETLIMVDQNGFEYKYSTTDLEDALKIRDSKKINDY